MIHTGEIIPLSTDCREFKKIRVQADEARIVLEILSVRWPTYSLVGFSSILFIGSRDRFYYSYRKLKFMLQFFVLFFSLRKSIFVQLRRITKTSFFVLCCSIFPYLQ